MPLKARGSGSLPRGWIGDAVQEWKHKRFVRRHLVERLDGMHHALRSVSSATVLLVGNSHAEFLGAPDFGGRPCINLGVGGSTVGDCATYLRSLQPSARAAASILFIGTNDIMRWQHPERQQVVDRFVFDLCIVLSKLKTWSDHVFVSDIPPVGAAAASRDPTSVVEFSDVIRKISADGTCVFFDPFAWLRDEDPGLAATGLHPDGVHLADYRHLADAVVRIVTRGLAARDACRPRTVAASSTLDRNPRQDPRASPFRAIAADGAHPRALLASRGQEA